MTKCQEFSIINLSKDRRKNKMKNTRGAYLFADGTECWVNGLSARDKAAKIRQHGAIIKFTPTN